MGEETFHSILFHILKWKYVYCFCFQGVNFLGGCEYSKLVNKLPDLYGKGEPNRFSGHRDLSVETRMDV